MAKRRKSRKSKAKSAPTGKVIANHGFGGRKFTCRGKHVKAGKSSKRIPRIFCARNEA